MRFNTLDGLRGIAAILVLFYHLGSYAPIAAPTGYLAVDLFFGLSGFVLSHAYEDRLRSGMPLKEFAILRLIRVYPMALFGAGLGVFFSKKFVLSLLLLPDFGGTGPLYPANVPLWSLTCELIVNVMFAAVAVWVSWRGLALILLSSGIVLAFGINTYAASGLGAFWQTAGYGLVRTVFSFALGVGMQRLHAKLEVRRQETMKALLVPIALFVLLTQMPGGQPYWDKVCVFLFLPALLWFGAVWEVPHAEPFRTLGEISYPLYCIHGAVLQATHGSRPHTYLWIALIVTAWLASRADRPIRLWLMQHRRILRAPTKPLPSQPLA